MSVRFDTWFFAAAAPPDAEPSVDGSECVDARWLRPADALAAHAAASSLLVFPTIKNLERLGETGSVAETLEAARRRPIVDDPAAGRHPRRRGRGAASRASPATTSRDRNPAGHGLVHEDDEAQRPDPRHRGRVRWGQLAAVAAASTLIGTDEADQLAGGETPDQIYGEGGNDTLTGAGSGDYLEAGSGDDTVDGGDGVDLLLGGTGNDRIDAGTGSDVVYAGAGEDLVLGGQGDDTLFGQSEPDRLFGGAGRDRIYASLGGDFVDAGSGADRISAEGGAATILAGGGDDIVTGSGGVIDVQGGGGRDRIRTGEANDRISGGGGSDSIDAGAGDDTMNALDGRRDRVNCGDGQDTAAVDPFDIVSGCEVTSRARAAARRR